jgi:HEAT repeat protein
MQAMAALAETRDPRAVTALVEVSRQGPDEALRMEAARHLGNLRQDPRAAEALRAATADSSAYVRLSALHGLEGSTDPALPGLLAQLAAHDRDAGVRLLAQRLLDALPR